jgi:hypothetical protein
MLYGEEVAVCSEINTKHINTVWAECTGWSEVRIIWVYGDFSATLYIC